jgi:hypothetical protein
MNLLRRLLVLSALAAVAHAQTTFTNQPGACTTDISCSLSLTSGTGNVTFAAIVGPACSLGTTCSFPSGFVGTHFAYQLPDGSSANADNFAGVMTYTGVGTCGAGCTNYLYSITGTFSGQDSLGRAFNGSTHQAITITNTSRSGHSAFDSGGATTLEFAGGPTPLPAILAFLNPLPSTLPFEGSIGEVLVGVEDSSGHVATGSMATITLSLAGPSGFENVTQIANASQGIATFALPASLTIPGQYTLSVSAAGLTSPSSVAITVNPSTGEIQGPDFDLTENQSTLTVRSGQSAAVALRLVPASGITDTVTFTCSGLPASATCSFNPTTLIFDGSNTPLTTQMTINTAVVAGMTAPGRHETPLCPASYQFFVVLLPAVLLCSGSRKRTKTAGQILIVAVLLVWIIGALSCGGSSRSALQTPTSSSTVVVTASGSSGVAHSVSIDLTLTK